MSQNNVSLTSEQKTAMQDAIESNDFSLLQELSQEYGINKRGSGGMRKGKMRGIFQNLTDEQKEALKEAKDSGDIDAVHALMEEYGIEMPNEEAYDALTDEQKTALEEAKKSGDRNSVHALMEEYGLEIRGGKGGSHRHEGHWGGRRGESQWNNEEEKE